MGRSENSINCSLNGVKVDIIRHEYKLLNNIEEIDQLRLWGLADIAAAKVSTVVNRGAKKDFYDIAELLKHFSINEIIGFYLSKYPSGTKFIALKSLVYFEDAEEDPDPETLNDISWERVKSIIKSTLH